MAKSQPNDNTDLCKLYGEERKKQRGNKNKKHGTVDGCGGDGVADKEG